MDNKCHESEIWSPKRGTCTNTHSTNNEKNNHNQRTNGPVNAHLISWPSKAQNIQNLENIW